MPVMRQDPTTKAWVIFATQRLKRPHDFRTNPGTEGSRIGDDSCPFCPGNEAMTPSEVLRVAGEDGRGWRVRVVPNKFAAFEPHGDLQRTGEDSLFVEMNAVGYHEVLIESPRHDDVLWRMDEDQVDAVLEACQRRYREIAKGTRIAWILVFKNYGERAGTSLEHPHLQITATPVAPAEVRRKYEVAAEHYDDTGRCLCCDLVKAELAERARVVHETESFVVFHPFASRVPFETWIAPKSHQPTFARASSGERKELARLLKTTLGSLCEGLGKPDFNFVIQSAPRGEEDTPYFLWHVEILPRLGRLAGFELGSGMRINTVKPEESAAFLRNFMTYNRRAAEGADLPGESKSRRRKWSTEKSPPS